MLLPSENASGTVTITVTVIDDGGCEGGGTNRVQRTFDVRIASPPAVPVLRIDLVGNVAAISWPAAESAGFILQTTSDFVEPKLWTTVETPPQEIDGRYAVRIVVDGACRFFRLCYRCDN